MEIYKKQTLAETFSVYFDPRMIKILLLGAISGFPWVIIGSSLSLWLKEDGLSRSTIGWAGLIFAVYAFNYLWAPIIDRVKIPWLTPSVCGPVWWLPAEPLPTTGLTVTKNCRLPCTGPQAVLMKWPPLPVNREFSNMTLTHYL